MQRLQSWLFATLGRSYSAALFDRKIRSAWHGNGIVNYRCSRISCHLESILLMTRSNPDKGERVR